MDQDMTVLATYLRPLVAPPTRKAWNGPCVRGPPPGRASSRGSGDRWNHRRRVVSYGDAKRQSIKGGYGALSWRWAGVEDSARRRGGVCHSVVRSRGHDVSGIEWVTIIKIFIVNYFGDNQRSLATTRRLPHGPASTQTWVARTDETKNRVTSAKSSDKSAKSRGCRGKFRDKMGKCSESQG